MFAAPPTLTGGGLIAYAAVTYILWGVTYTMMDIPFWSMIPAFTEGGKERESLTTLARSCAGVGSALITIITMICVPRIGKMGHADLAEKEIERYGFQRFAFIIAVLFILLLVLTGVNIKEKSTINVDTPSVGQMFRALFSNNQAITCAGILGYECNLCDVKPEELQEIKEQIKLYKQWREVLQFGQMYRLRSGKMTSSYDTDMVRWNIVALDQNRAVGITLQGQAIANYAHRSFQAKGLAEEKRYHFYNRMLKYDIHRMGDLINTIAPVHIKQDSVVHGILSKCIKLDGEIENVLVYGSILNKVGVQLSQSYAGTGFGNNTALYQDYDAKLYLMEAE